MTYQALLQLVESEMRDATSFPLVPDDTSKLSEQLRVAYVSCLTILSDLPVYDQPITESSALTKTGYVFALPDNLFKVLPDAGIKFVVFDAKKYNPGQAQSRFYLDTVRGKRFYQHTILFAFEEQLRSIEVLDADLITEAKIQYVALPAEPASDTYDSLEIPVKEPHVQRVVELIAARFYGYQQDAYFQKFHQVWSSIYDVKPEAVANA